MQAPSAALAGRYRFKDSARVGARGAAWLAEDTTTGRVVVASAVPAARAATMQPLVGVRHPSLATVLEVVTSPNAAEVPGGKPVPAVGVAEWVEGETLHARLKRGPLEPRQAVDAFARLAHAVAALHRAGGAHGAISPRSIVLSPEGDMPGPCLTQLLAPTSGAYCAPERLQGRGPSTADDVWALHATLFAALTCSPPYKGETKDELLLSIAGGRKQSLESLGLKDELLSMVLESGLTADVKRRKLEIAALMDALERWTPAAAEWADDEATAVVSSDQLAAAMLADPMSQKAPPQPAPSLPPVSVEEEPRVADEDETLDVGAGVAAVARAAHAAPPPHAPVPVAPKAPAGLAPAARPAATPAPAAPHAYAAPPAPAAPPAYAPPAPAPPPVYAPPAPAAPPAYAAPTALEPAVAPDLDEPNPYDDEDDATLMMGRPPIEDIQAMLAAPSDRPEPEPPPIPSAANLNPPVEEPFPGARAPLAPAQDWPAPAPAAAPPPHDAFGAYPPVSMPPPGAGSVAPQVDLSDVEVRRASRGPIVVIVIILVLVAAGIGVAMFLNNRAARAGRLRSDVPRPVPSAIATAPVARASAPLPSATATERSTAAPSAAAPSAAVTAAAPSAAAPPAQDRGSCVARHFEPGTLTGKEDFQFLCQAEDFRGINSQLHRRLVVAGAGKVTPGMREWSALSWFELAATAVIRAACCPPSTSPPNLPETGAGCPTLGPVLKELAVLPVSASEIPERSKAFESAVVCLFAKGIPRPYNYTSRPTGHARRVFEGFLARTVRS